MAERMQLITNLQQLDENITTFDTYLNSAGDERSEALGYVARGRCFVVVDKPDGKRFYPSRFIGYAGNTLAKHALNTPRDGRKTNAAIDEILGERSSEHESPELNDAFQDFCDELGIYPDDKEHKFWSHVLEK